MPNSERWQLFSPVEVRALTSGKFPIIRQSLARLGLHTGDDENSPMRYATVYFFSSAFSRVIWALFLGFTDDSRVGIPIEPWKHQQLDGFRMCLTMCSEALRKTTFYGLAKDNFLLDGNL